MTASEAQGWKSQETAATLLKFATEHAQRVTALLAATAAAGESQSKEPSQMALRLAGLLHVGTAPSPTGPLLEHRSIHSLHAVVEYAEMPSILPTQPATQSMKQRRALKVARRTNKEKHHKQNDHCK